MMSNSKYLHRNLERDKYFSLFRNITIVRNENEYCVRPSPDLPIDDIIESLISAEESQRPRIDLSVYRREHERCPYQRIRFGICQAVKAADAEDKIASGEKEQYKNAKRMIDTTSEIMRLCHNMSKGHKLDDLIPFPPRFIPDRYVIDITRESTDFLALERFMENIEGLNSAARALVATRERKYAGGRPEYVWERTFAEFIADHWRAMTGEDIRRVEYTNKLADFIDAAFKSIYKSFNHNGTNSIYKEFRFVAPSQDWKTFAASARKDVAARDAHEREMWELDPSRGDKLNLIGYRADGSPLYSPQIVMKTLTPFKEQLVESYANASTLPVILRQR